jgi:hypothetical protein
MSQKLNNYGTKLIIVADAKTWYMLNAHVYCGKEHASENFEFSVPRQHVLRFIKPLEHT